MKFSKNKAFTIAIVLSVVLLFCSCSSTKKMKTSETKKIDSTGTSVKNNTAVAKSDSSSLHASNSDFDFTVEATFDTSKTAGEFSTAAVDHTGQLSIPDALDFFPTDQHANHTKFQTISVNGKTLTSNVPINTLKFSFHGHDSTLDITQLKKTDSSINNDSSSSHVISSDNISTKDKSTKGANIIIWVAGLIILALVFMVGQRFGWWAFFTKKSSSNS